MIENTTKKYSDKTKINKLKYHFLKCKKLSNLEIKKKHDWKGKKDW